MKLNRPSLFLVLCAIFLVSCSTDGDEDCAIGEVHSPNAVDIVIDGDQYRQSSLDCRLPRVQNFTASNLQGATIIGEQGTVIFINKQGFDQNGIFIDGDVDVALIEMYQPGEIIACQLSTNGVNLNGNIEPLFSESLFFIDITYEGAPVNFLQPLRVFVPSENLDVQQFLFASPTCPELECAVLWEEVISTIPVFEEPFIDAAGNITTGYFAIIPDVGWKNIGRYNEDTNPRSIVYNKAQRGYNKTNGNVFINYNSPSLAIGLFDAYDENLEVFTERFAQIPIGTEVAIIFVTVQNNEYLYSTKNGTVIPDFLTATLETQSTDETGLINALNNL